MNARELHSRWKAAAAAFRLAGGRNPKIILEGDRMEIIEAPNSTNLEEAARTQALIDQGLGGSGSPK